MKPKYVFVLTIIICFTQNPVMAQSNEKAMQRYSWRGMVVMNMAWFTHDKPHTTLGIIYQHSLRQSQPDSMAKDSVLFTINKQLQQHLVRGPLHRKIKEALEINFLNIADSASVLPGDEGWLIKSGSEKYTLTLKDNALAVSTFLVSRTVELPKWYWHAMAYAGIRGSTNLAFLGNLGIVRRNQSDIFTVAGLGVHAAWPLKGLGPFLRVEILDVIGVQGGLVYTKNKYSGLFFSIDIMQGILGDLELF